MIWFWLIAGLLILVTLIALLRPLVRGAAVNPDHSEPITAIYGRELANIDNEVSQGRLLAAQAAVSRAEVTRRMLAASDEESRRSVPNDTYSAENSRRFGAALGIAALLPVSALVVYITVGTPAAMGPTRPAEVAGRASTPPNRSELSAVADQLKTRLQQEPGHKDGWVLLGRTFTSLGRFAEAREAYGRAIALAPNEPELHAELGELLVLTSEGAVTPEAEAEFAKSDNDPRARFYGAEAALQRGDKAAARAGLRSLLADAPADAPWRKVVAERLVEISPGEPQIGAPGPTPSNASSGGPTPQDVAAAQAMSPDERQKMIRSMVDRLAARLEQNPNDTEGWGRLAHAYDVLGETDKASAARLRAAAASAAVSPPSASPPK